MLTSADTAFAIAHIRAIERERAPEERLFDDPHAAVFAAAGAHAAAGTRRFLELPFMLDAIRLRTRFIDDAVRDALADGIRQIVVLGAGFDVRGLRMPEIPAHGVTVFEVDFARQLENKRALLSAANVPLPEWVKYVACDFTAADFEGGLTTSLVAHGYRRDAAALFVWEGVIPYIGPEAADRSLRFMARVGGPGSRVVFDFAPMALEPDTAAERTRRAGFARFEEVRFDVIWRRYLKSEPHPNAVVACMGTASV
jgi:methyltransferase (TIGR00027 family)